MRIIIFKTGAEYLTLINNHHNNNNNHNNSSHHNNKFPLKMLKTIWICHHLKIKAWTYHRDHPLAKTYKDNKLINFNSNRILTHNRHNNSFLNKIQLYNKIRYYSQMVWTHLRKLPHLKQITRIRCLSKAKCPICTLIPMMKKLRRETNFSCTNLKAIWEYWWTTIKLSEKKLWKPKFRNIFSKTNV